MHYLTVSCVYLSLRKSTSYTHTHTIEGAPSKAVVYAQWGAFPAVGHLYVPL